MFWRSVLGDVGWGGGHTPHPLVPSTKKKKDGLTVFSLLTLTAMLLLKFVRIV